MQANGTGAAEGVPRPQGGGPAPADPPLTAILQHLRSEPSRTWSIVITVFGDAIVPRGSALWLGSLLEIFAGMAIGPGAVRTAMSRLAHDGWLQRNRVGRNSFYRLTGKGHASFADATARIYGAPPAHWDGRLRLVLPAIPDRETGRDALERAGFGTTAQGLWIGPLALPVPPGAGSLMHLTGCMDVATGRRLAAEAWPLAGIAARYDRFVVLFGPLRDWTARNHALSDLDALLARIFLIHEYRRIVLRDPMLPAVLLPDNWPGRAARALCMAIYAALVPGSEAWLDRYGQNEGGALPPPEFDLRLRFALG